MRTLFFLSFCLSPFFPRALYRLDARAKRQSRQRTKSCRRTKSCTVEAQKTASALQRFAHKNTIRVALSCTLRTQCGKMRCFARKTTVVLNAGSKRSKFGQTTFVHDTCVCCAFRAQNKTPAEAGVGCVCQASAQKNLATRSLEYWTVSSMSPKLMISPA